MISLLALALSWTQIDGSRRSVALVRRKLKTSATVPLMHVRGGGTEDPDKESRPQHGVIALLDRLTPGVRMHVVGVAACTLIAMSGMVDAGTSLGLDNALTLLRLQVWRPVTSALFLGTPSMSWATSLYLLIKYGQELESAVGTTPYVKFLMLQTFLLWTMASVIGLPFIAHGLVTAIIYACSRLEPFGEIQFQFGIKLKYYMLPYGLLVIDMLQRQSVLGALPHMLGILCAHFHHFFAVVWPNLNAANNNMPLMPRAKASLLTSEASGQRTSRRKLGG